MDFISELKGYLKIYSGRIAECIQLALFRIKEQDEEIKFLNYLLKEAEEDLKKWNDYEHNIVSMQVYNRIKAYLEAE